MTHFTASWLIPLVVYAFLMIVCWLVYLFERRNHPEEYIGLSWILTSFVFTAMYVLYMIVWFIHETPWDVLIKIQG